MKKVHDKPKDGDFIEILGNLYRVKEKWYYTSPYFPSMEAPYKYFIIIFNGRETPVQDVEADFIRPSKEEYELENRLLRIESRLDEIGKGGRLVYDEETDSLVQPVGDRQTTRKLSRPWWKFWA